MVQVVHIQGAAVVLTVDVIVPVQTALRIAGWLIGRLLAIATIILAVTLQRYVVYMTILTPTKGKICFSAM